MATDEEYLANLRAEREAADDELRRLRVQLDQAGCLPEFQYEDLRRRVTAQQRLVNELGECLR